MAKGEVEMGSATTVRSAPSGYFLQSAAIRPVTKQTVKFGGRQRLAIAPPVVSDLSLIYPEAVVASSQPLGWQNLRALEMRQTISEWTMPPLENHCIVIQLGPSVDVTARIGDENFDQRLEPGAIIIVPAGLSVDWHQEDTPSHTLHLYLDPQFLRTTAESIDVDYGQVSIATQFGIRDEHLHHLGMSLRHELKDANVIGRLYADSLAQVLAMQLVRRYSYLKVLQTSRGGEAARKLRKGIQFIYHNLDLEQKVTLGAVGEATQISFFH